ncbi:MAG: glycine-rich domain-containing protein [Bacteroidota bacterium]
MKSNTNLAPKVKIGFSQIFRTLILIFIFIFATTLQLFSQTLIPFSGSNSIDCGTNTTLCTHAGCGGTYSSSASGYTVLNSADNAVITISGSYDTESGYDYIRIYSGSGTGGSLLATYNGNSTFTYTGSAGETLTVGFTSDGSVEYSGLNASVTYSGSCVAPIMVPFSGNNTYTTCSGNIYDHGGGSGDYASSANGYTVLYPAVAGNKIKVSGSLVSEANWDYLTIYNGVGTGGTELYRNSGTQTVPAIYSTDASGALTVMFTSDGSVVGAGFDLGISCFNPTIIDNTIYANGATGSINVCPGVAFTISSSGGSSGNMCYWGSSNGGSSWDLFAGSYCNQSSYTYTLNTPGSYLFHVRNSDADGYCWDAGRSCGPAQLVTVNVISPPSAGTMSLTNPTCGSTYVFSLSGNSGTVEDWEYSWASASGPWTNWGQGSVNTVNWGPGGSAGLYVHARIVGNGCTVWSNVVGPTATPPTVGENINCPIDAGTLACTSPYSNTQNNGSFANDYGQASGDIFYKFTLSSTQTVQIKTCGSGFDTYLSLLDNAGNVITINDDDNSNCANNESFISTSLAAGTYYVVSEGFSSYTGNINTQISIIDATPPSHDNVTVNSNCWTTDGSHDYTITMVSSDPSGFGGAYGIMALINYQGANAGQHGGYFSWHPSSYVYAGDHVVASGGGYASKYDGGYGQNTSTLINCSTSLSGIQRTVVFTIRPNTNFPQLAENDVSMYTTDACGNAYGWTNWETNFSSATGSNAGTITGVPASICNGSNVTYTLSGYNGTFIRFQYQWNSTSGGWTDWGGTNPYVWTSGNPGNTLYVRGVVSIGNCTSYSSPVSTYVTPYPSGGSISGNSTPCPYSTNTYTVSGVSNATGYTWTVPSGASINSGQGTTSISVTFGSTRGNITCAPANGSCVGADITSYIDIDPTSPTYIGTSVSNANYVSGTNYFVKNGGTSYINIQHSDNCSSSTQYLELTQQPNNLFGSWSLPNIKSYANPNGVAQNGYFTSFVDGLVDNSLLDIQNSQCVSTGNCNVDVNGKWQIVAGSGASTRYHITVYMYDQMGQGVGYTDSGLDLWLDNTLPSTPGTPTTGNGGLNSQTWTTSGSSDGESGVNGSGYEWEWSYDNSVWNTWFTGSTSNSGTWVCDKSVFIRVRSKDNVGNVSAWSSSGNASTSTSSTPPVSISGTTSICSGGSTVLTAVGGTDGTGASYQWYADACGSGSALSTSNSLTINNLASTTSYFVRRTGTCATTACAGTTVTVNSLSNAPSVSGLSSVCVGSSIPLTVSTPQPTGGSIATSGGYRIHTYTGVGSSSFEIPTGFSFNKVEVLVVAGGGGGGWDVGGGGGGGGLIYNTLTVSPSSIPVSVGAGGLGSTSGGGGTALSGGNSIFGSLTAIGGGGGGNWSTGVGGSGGSGGGATSNVSGGGGTATIGQGFAGGASANNTSNINLYSGASGGGGAGQAGGNGTSSGWSSNSTTYGYGGNGLQFSISGTPTYYAGGGGSSDDNGINWGRGGLGGGANGNSNNATANTGGGGGGGGLPSNSGGNGGSGIVIVRYPDVPAGSWSSSNNLVATVEPSTGVVTGVAGGTASIIYTITVNGCATQTSKEITVNTSSVSPTSISGTTTICSGGSTTLTSVGGSNGSGASYQWYADGCGLGSVLSTSSTLDISGLTSTTSYFVRRTGTCSTTACAGTTVTINTLTTTPVIAGESSICVGTTTTFSSNIPMPTGGSIGTLGGYRTHTYTGIGSSTFEVPTGFSYDKVELLVVAGGGGGGGSTAGGGGGGGVIYSTYAISSGASYSVTVGTGGIGGRKSDDGSVNNTNGDNSSFGTYTAIGGGYGFSGKPTGSRIANSGGSGGGAGYYSGNDITINSPGSGTANQGYSGGTIVNTSCWGGAGGGGAGGAAGSNTTLETRYGGIGLQYSISGVNTYYGGGGGGGVCDANPASLGGLGGGGNGGSGAPNLAQSGTPNTGGGGGGGGYYQSGTGGGSGGSGIVVIRYPNITPGTWSSSNTSVATVDPSSGVVSGVAGGTANIIYTITVNGCPTSVSRAITVKSSYTMAPITGTTSICKNGTTTLSTSFPTGGTITSSNSYRIHSYTSSGSFITPVLNNYEVLVVAGGGGGASGGGGSGGILYNSNYALSAGSASVIIGNGGTGGSALLGGAIRTNGENSQFSALTAIGGGAGGTNDALTSANSGGSGGGGGSTSTVNTNGGLGTVNQGYAGGTVSSTKSSPYASAGGGGAGSYGNPPISSSISGNGGVGFPYNFTGSNIYYAGGGGGGTWSNGTHGIGGIGGGGSGAYPNGIAGTANSGGGGGGGCGGGSGTGGNGGSGIVIVRYPDVTAGSWSSSNTDVATVDPSTGIVTGISSGTSTITFSYTCGSLVSSASTLVTVKNDVGITSATATTSPICAASTTTVTANGVVGTNAVVTWYTGSGGTGINLGSGTTKTVGPGTYYAQVTGDCGTAVEASVTVASKINVGITSATADASPICAASTTTVTANGVTGTNAVVTWWSATGGTGTNLGTGTTKTFGPGTYYARVTGDCGSAVETSVTVVSKINVGITSATADASPICAASTTTVTANGVTGTNAVVTWWSATGGTGTNLGTGTTKTFGPGTYYARVTGDCGTAVEASVTVVSKINVGITSATADASPICTASTTTVTANGVVGTNAVVTWYTGSGGTGINLGSGTTKTVGPGTYYAQVTGDCGTAVEASVTVASKINVGITSATADASPICAASTTTVTANGVVGTNAVVTWWSATGGTGTNLGTGTTKTFGPGTYYARVTGDCGSAVETSVTVVSKINVGITSATADASPICAASTTTVTANGVTGTNAVVTWWSATGGTGTNLGTGTTKTFGPGTYYARVTGDCGTAVEASVTVVSKINVGITSATATESPICAASTTTVTANGVTGTNAVVTWWSATGGTGTNLGTGTTKTFGPGTYYARVTGDCGTAVEASVTVATQQQSISLSSGTQSPTVCNGIAIPNIVLAVGGSSTGASITIGSFPSGVTGSYSGGNYTITGSPSVAGSFPYTITTSGLCPTAEISGTITVNNNPSITIKARCINTGRSVELIGGSGSGVYNLFEQQLPLISQDSNVFEVSFGQTKIFRLRDNNGCWSPDSSYSTQIAPTEITGGASSGTCIVKGINSWWHVTDATNHVILSIDDNTSNLGEITATSYVEATTNVYHQTYYLKRHFKITSQNTPTSPVTLRLYFTDEELNELITNSKLNVNVEDDVNDLSNLKVTRYSGVNEDNDYSNNDTTCGACFTVYTPSTGVDMGANYVQITVPGFSEEWIHGGTNNTSILPIELMTFKPECLGKNAFIRWITASEINNNFFVLERSENGVDYQSIAQIQGAGNSSEILEYSYLDTQKPEGLVYYRLKQVDFNGVIHTYNPVPLSCKNESMALRVVPNPFKEKISIIGSLPNETQIELFNGKGGRVYSESKNIVNSTELDLNFLAPGIYLLRLTELNGVVHQFRLVRN